MKKLKSILKKCFDIFAFCLCVKGNEIEKEMIEQGLLSREGQGATNTGIKGAR